MITEALEHLQKAKNKAARYCSVDERSNYQVLTKLQLYGLEYLEEKMENIFVREDAFMDLGQAPNVDLADASIFDLITCFNEALERTGEEDLKEIFAEEYTVSQKITYITESLKITKQLSIEWQLVAQCIQDSLD